MKGLKEEGRVLKPKAIGSIVLIYALGMHLLSGIEGGLGVLGFLTNRIPYRISNPYIFILVNLLSGLYLLSYLAGGVGLILLRRWASLLVFMTGGVEFITGVVTLVSSFLGQQSMVPYQVLIYWLAFGFVRLIAPAAIACMAMWLRKNSDAWLVIPGKELTSPDAIQEKHR